MRVKTKAELSDHCKNWKMGDDVGFAEIVSIYLAVTGDQRTLADEFEAAISTVPRWAKGIAKPLRRVQVEVVAWIALVARR